MTVTATAEQTNTATADRPVWASNEHKVIRNIGHAIRSGDVEEVRLSPASRRLTFTGPNVDFSVTLPDGVCYRMIASIHGMCGTMSHSTYGRFLDNTGAPRASRSVSWVREPNELAFHPENKPHSRFDFGFDYVFADREVMSSKLREAAAEKHAARTDLSQSQLIVLEHQVQQSLSTIPADDRPFSDIIRYEKGVQIVGLENSFAASVISIQMEQEHPDLDVKVHQNKSDETFFIDIKK